jgi:hypothetical protein
MQFCEDSPRYSGMTSRFGQNPLHECPDCASAGNRCAIAVQSPAVCYNPSSCTRWKVQYTWQGMVVADIDCARARAGQKRCGTRLTSKVPSTSARWRYVFQHTDCMHGACIVGQHAPGRHGARPSQQLATFGAAEKPRTGIMSHTPCGTSGQPSSKCGIPLAVLLRCT